MAQSQWAHGIVPTLSILVLGASPGGVQAQSAPTSLAVTVESITEATMLGHLSVLASDELRGRDTPSEGLETAASYLATQHLNYGLAPAGTNGTFVQRYPFGLMGPDPENAQVTFVGPDGSEEVRVGRDAFLDGGSNRMLDAALTFVTLTAQARPREGSMEGEVAVFSLPGRWGQSLWLTSLEQASYARASGAVAVVHVLDSGFPSSAVTQLGPALAQPTWRLGRRRLSAARLCSEPGARGCDSSGVCPLDGSCIRIPERTRDPSADPGLEAPGQSPTEHRERCEPRECAG